MAVKLSVPGSAKLPEEKDVSPNTFPGNHKAQSGALAKTWDGCEATDGWLVLLATQPSSVQVHGRNCFAGQERVGRGLNNVVCLLHIPAVGWVPFPTLCHHSTVFSRECSKMTHVLGTSSLLSGKDYDEDERGARLETGVE